MSVLTFVLGLAMAVAGAVSIGMGVPYIRMEFGWTEVIAGVTALCAGLVVVAVAAMLTKLDRLIRAIERNAGNSDGRGTGERPAPEAVDAIATSVPRQNEPAPALAGVPGDAPPPDAPDDPAPELFAEAPDPVTSGRRSLLGRFGRARTARSDAPPAPPLSVDVGPPPPGTLAREAPRVEPALAAEPFGHAAPGLDVAPVPGGQVAEGAPPQDATVMGRYEAGGASYVLFSDGTIEVETETGVHRFGSMAELKQFIDHGEG